jgi:rod shape-determining protein MreD
MLNSNYFYTSLSFVAALLLQIIPINGSIAYWRPQFLLLLVFYWLFYGRSKYGVGFAWMIGIILDMFAGEMFGRYAITFSLCAYFLILLSKRLHHFGIFHQAVLIFFMVLLNQLLVTSISLLYRADWSVALLMGSSLTSALIWPLLALVMNKIFSR